MFSVDAIPTDGVNSLNRTATPVAVNSPTNFAGEMGSINVPEPGTTALGGAALATLLALRLQRAQRIRRSRTRQRA